MPKISVRWIPSQHVVLIRMTVQHAQERGLAFVKMALPMDQVSACLNMMMAALLNIMVTLKTVSPKALAI